MDRRDFIKKGSCGICVALGSGFLMSALLEACATPLGVYKTASDNKLVRIPLTEFKESNYKIIRVNNYNYDLAVQKNGDGSYTVLELMCTHAGQPLTKTGQNYYCTLHGSQFDHAGHVTKGPAEKNLKQLETTTTKDELLITLPVS
jgi:cytochrome b6-f complex iron-sulfur subunit